MTFAPFGAPTNIIFQDLELLKVKDIIKLQQLKLVHGFYEESLPEDLMSLFTLSKEYSTSQVLTSEYNNLLFIPKFNSVTYGKKSLKYHCAKLWNETFKTSFICVDENKNNNVKVTEIETKKKFNNVLKRHFLYKYSLN